MNERAMHYAIQDDPVLGEKLDELAVIFSQTRGCSFEQAKADLISVLSDFTIYVIEEEP